MRTIEPEGIRDIDGPLWRYFTAERFVTFLESSALYFASARQFEDPFEGAIAIQPPGSAEPRDIGVGAIGIFEELRRLTKISCWNEASYESETMWKLYAGERKGVALVTTKRRLGDALLPFRLAPNYGDEEPWWGSVKYVDLSMQTLHLNALERFFYKHKAFETEREFRVLISLRLAEEFGVEVPELGITVPVNIQALIETVILGPGLEPHEVARVVRACKQCGLAERIATSTLLWSPRYITFRRRGGS